jgi:hypothetical protein
MADTLLLELTQDNAPARILLEDPTHSLLLELAPSLFIPEGDGGIVDFTLYYQLAKG